MILTIKDLTKQYHLKNNDITVLENICLTVNEHEVIAILGTSGCGKSTLLSIISSLLNYDSGTIKYKDHFNYGYMLQKDMLLPYLTVKENCLLGLRIKKQINEEKLKQLDDLLIKYHLKNYEDSYPDNLSGGMRQRVALIRTILLDPDLYLLDEPFSALDYQNKKMLLNDIKKLIDEKHQSMIIVTHDVNEAISLANRIIILSNKPAHIIKEITLDNPDIDYLTLVESYIKDEV
ncbi:MAG: ATP-binding cassette domain-containing protein [Bacilli bacterium]|nr:ATP-binding cassette domain-containing protein [Bacilli bacterium]